MSAITKKRAPSWKERYDEAAMLIKEKGGELLIQRQEWRKICTGRAFKPTIRCIKHGELVYTTNLNRLQQGQGIGCKQCNSSMQTWPDKYEDACLLAASTGGELLVTKEDWKASCTGKSFAPPIRCLKHNIVVRTSTLSNLLKGQSLGCERCLPSLVRWKDRFDEVEALILANGGKLLHTKDEWKSLCHGNEFRPKIMCLKHGDIVQTTRIAGLQQGQGIGCIKCISQLNPWAGRYEEFADLVAKKGGILQMSKEEWCSSCTGNDFKPPIMCIEHGEVATSTTVNKIAVLRGFNCPKCLHKTEVRLLEWLRFRHNDVQTQRPKFKRSTTGGTLRFDMSSPSEKWIIELDGDIPGGHFDQASECPQRDLEKEQWARAHGYQVIRVLQQHVWRNRKNWDDYLSTQIAAWNERRIQGLSPGDAITPQEPEYREGIYAELRRSQHL